MEPKMDFFRIGDDVEFKDEDKSDILEVLAKSDDEVLLSVSSGDYPRNEIVIARTSIINGVKYRIGDKVKVRTKNKDMVMYISYLLDKKALVLSFKKKPSYSSIKWLLRLMSESV